MRIKKILVLVFTLFLFTAVFTSQAYAQDEKTVIVQYKSLVGKQTVQEIATEVLSDLQSLNMLTVTISQNQLDRLKENPEILTVEENQTFTIQSQALFKVATDTSVEKDRWNLKSIQAENAWADGFTGKGVKIAIIDSGVASHQDLKIKEGVSFVGDSYTDGHGHGTHIAGIIAAQHNGFGVAGIAPNAEIYAVKAIEDDGFGSVDTIIQAIDWSIHNDMDLINLSFGDLESSDALHEAIKQAKQAGILIIASSGNEGTAQGTGNTMIYPARHEEVIAVASVNKNLKRSTFSSTGEDNDFAAPGEDIYSTYLNGQYATYQGTSLAAPHIAGLFALLMEQFPYLNEEELYAAMKSYVEDLGTPGFDEWYGYGFPKYQHNEQTEKLVALNESKSQVLQKEVAAFVKAPSAVKYAEIMEKLNLVRTSAMKESQLKEIEKAATTLSKSAEKIIATFERKPTNETYLKASEALKTVPEIAAKTKLVERVNTALLQLAKPAIEKVERYEKSPTKIYFTQAKFAITRLPDSTVKTELLARLNKVSKS
jgi:minor extracellular protease Epr